MSTATVFSDDPVAMAKHWAGEGAKRLHIVDLNGAIAGRPKNEKVIRDIVAAVGDAVPIQLGGGIRDLDAIESYLDAGVTYVVIGTAAVKNPGFLSDACYAFPGHVIAGLDAKDGKVAVEGWSKLTGHDVVDLAKKFEEYGVEAIIYTDIGATGMMTGVNIDATFKLAQQLKTPIIALGGLNSLKDVQAVVRSWPEGIIGVIAGRALYEGKIDLYAQAAQQGAREENRAAGQARDLRLDVTAGRVVKGVGFVGLRDAGDPVEIAARYDGEGADEVCFLDITASSMSATRCCT